MKAKLAERLALLEQAGPRMKQAAWAGRFLGRLPSPPCHTQGPTMRVQEDGKPARQAGTRRLLPPATKPSPGNALLLPSSAGRNELAEGLSPPGPESEAQG